MPFVDSHPVPTTPTGKDAKSSMPNLESVIQSVRNSRSWDFSTKEGLCEYTNACVVALHDADSGFGHLQKTEGQNHCVDPEGRFTATDVALYLNTGQVVDFIQSAGYGTPPPENAVCWQPGPVGEYPSSSWIDPVPGLDGGGGEGEGGGGGEVPTDIQAQLDRIEQSNAEMKLFLSNMNEQMALMGGEINNSRVAMDRPLVGEMVKTGQQLTLRPS